MAKVKPKSKVFILKRSGSYGSRTCDFFYDYQKPKPVQTLAGSLRLCHRTISRFFGISLKPGEKKKVRITIEEL